MDVDVIVVGSGQAGVPLATRLAGRGRRVLLVERGPLGGTCVNTGCTPTKTIVASARAAHVARTAARLGVAIDGVRVDFEAVMARKDALVARWREGVARRLADAGERLEVHHGQARLAGDHAVTVGADRHRADTIVLDVGARPVEPPIPGLSEVPWLDHERLLALRVLPQHLVVLGGGYVGCELAQAYHRLGAQVTLIEPGPQLMAREDPEPAEALAAALQGEGLRLVLGARAEAVSPGTAGIDVRLDTGERLAASHLLVATGRRPNTDDLGCAEAGVALDPHGAVVVDDHYRTTAPGVYAVGDCAGGPQFTHTAWDDHRLLFDVLDGRPGRGRKDRIIPYAAYTDPQVAGVGLTEREARRRGIRHALASLPFAQVARAIETDEPAGLLRLLLDPDSERILGASIVGAEAGELVHVFAVLMAAGAPVRALVDLEVVHPSLAEGLQSLVMSLDRYRLS